MKKTAVFFALFVILSLTLPIFAVKRQDLSTGIIKKANKNEENIVYEKTRNDNVFKIKLKNSDKIVFLSYKEYLFGCIAAEMPISFEEEALKAQGVAAFSYALYKKENSKEDYDITDDYKVDQCYFEMDKIKEKWGESFDSNSEKLNSLIDEILGYKLTYKGKTALTVYHSLSSGKTFSAKEVWGKEIPYLSSVDCSSDRLDEKYQTVVTVKKEEFIKFFNEKTGKKISDIKSLKTQKSENGRTLSLIVSNESVSSSDIVKEYDLRSSCFDADISDGNIVFNVFGYGHGVGMSQSGANYMAKNGSGFEEILNHFYKDCKIEKVKI